MRSVALLFALIVISSKTSLGLVQGQAPGASRPEKSSAKSPGKSPERSPDTNAGKALAALFSEIWDEQLRHAPEYASTLGDKRYNDQLSNYSAAEVNASLARGRGYIERLGAIGTSGLSEQEQISATLMLRSLIDDQEGARFKEWEMPVTQRDGFPMNIAELPAQLTFETIKDFEDWTARLRKIPVALSQIETNMMLGMDERRVPPRYLMQKVLLQTSALAEMKPAESPFALPLKQLPASVSIPDRKRISDEMLEAIATDVLPAYHRFTRFLEAQYIPACRNDPGVWAIPDGDAFYAFKVKQSTTLDKTPAEIHRIGVEEVKRDEAEMLAVAKRLGFADLKSLGDAIKANPRLHPTSGEALVNTYRGYEDAMRPKLPELFETLPKARLEVVPVPKFMEKDQTAAYYQEGSPDGKRPGRVSVNTYDFANRSLAPVEAIAYHEGLPGHHLQISTAQELNGLPEFRKHQDYTAYTEGWGLYAERLGKDVGFYQDSYSDYGRLENDVWRAIRLVVDTGVHSDHWTRQQMVDYFHEHSTMDEPNVQEEVDRYISWPGQALGYKIGQLKLLELRDRARNELGPKFDIRSFHSEVLDSGALPLDVLDGRVTAWIAARRR